MHVTIRCAGCSRPLRLPPEVVGHTVQCPLCQTTFLTRASTDNQPETIPLSLDESPLPLMETQGEELHLEPMAEEQPQVPDLSLDPVDEPFPPSTPKLSLELEESLPVLEEEEDEEEDATPLPMPLPAPPRPREREPERERSRSRDRDRDMPFDPDRRRRRTTTKRRSPFQLYIHRDPDDRLKGVFDGEIKDDTLLLWRGRGRTIELPVNTPCEYLGKGRLSLTIEGRKVELTTVHPDGLHDALARRIDAFLARREPTFVLPKRPIGNVFWLAFLPLLIPPLTLLIPGLGGITGVVVSGILVALTAVGCFAIVVQRNWSPLSRAVCAGAIILVTYGIFGIVSAVAMQMPEDRLHPERFEWVLFAPVDGGYKVEMPGSPIRIPHRDGLRLPGELRDNWFLELREKTTFFAGYADYAFDQPPQQRLDQLIRMFSVVNRGLQVRNQRELAVDGRIGREVTFTDHRRGSQVIGRFVIHDRRVFVTLLSSARLTTDSPEARRFLDSFAFDNTTGWPGPGTPGVVQKPPVVGGNPNIPPPPVLPPNLYRLDIGPRFVVFSMDMAVSPDGSRVVYPNHQGLLQIFNPQTKQVQSDRNINFQATLAVHPNNRVLAHSSATTVQLRDLVDRREVGSFTPQTWQSVSALCFSPDGNILAVGHQAGANLNAELRLWDTKTRNQIAFLRGPTNKITGLAFSPDGHILAAVSSGSSMVHLYEIPTGREFARLKGHTASLNGVAWSSDGKWIATSSADQTVRLWSPKTLRQAFVLRGHTRPVGPIAFSPDGTTLVSGGWDQTVRFWDVPSGTFLHCLNHEGTIQAVGFGTAGRSLVVRSSDQRLSLWDLTPIGELKKRPQPVNADVKNSPAPEQPDLQPVARIVPPVSYVIAPEKKCALVSTRDRLLLRYSYPEWKLTHVSFLGTVAYQLALDQAKGILYAAVSEPTKMKNQGLDSAWIGEGELQLYDVQSLLAGTEPADRLKPMTKLDETMQVRDMCLSPDQKWLYLLDKKPFMGTIRQFDTTTRKLVNEIPLQNTVMQRLVASPDGETLYLLTSGRAGTDTQLVTLTSRNGKLQKEYKIGQRTQDLQPQRDRVALSGLSPFLLDLKSGETSPWRGPGGGSSLLLLSPDGERVYVFNRFGGSRVESYPLKVGPGQAPLERFAAASDDSLGRMGWMTNDGKFLICSEGMILRLADGEVQMPVSRKEPEPKEIEPRIPELPGWKDGHTGRVLGLAMNVENEKLTTVGDDSRAVTRQWRTGTIEKQLNISSAGGLNAVAWTRDGRHYAVTSWNGTARIMNPAHTSIATRRRSPGIGIDTICFSPDGNWVIVSSDKTANGWATRRGFLPDRLLNSELHLTATAVNPRTGKVGIGTTTGEIEIHDLKTQQRIESLKGHDQEVRALDFGRDGKYLATVDIAGTLRIWDATTNKETHKIQAHTAVIQCAAFAPDGKTLATGALDGSVKLWDAEKGIERVSIKGDRSRPVYGVTFSGDGKMLFAATQTGVRRWDTSTVVGRIVAWPPVVELKP